MAYKFTSGKSNYTAYRIPDKKFYSPSDTGSRVGSGYPLPVTARLSLPFDSVRFNFVSREASPYNGTDCSMPVSTKIVNVVNGKVTRVEYSNTMNYPVEVFGKDNVKMRYLRLSEILVKKGTPVSRGTATALSDNSGRSSGLHLHCGLATNNSPVNSPALRVAGSTDNNKLE